MKFVIDTMLRDEKGKLGKELTLKVSGLADLLEELDKATWSYRQVIKLIFASISFERRREHLSEDWFWLVCKLEFEHFGKFIIKIAVKETVGNVMPQRGVATRIKSELLNLRAVEKEPFIEGSLGERIFALVLAVLHQILIEKKNKTDLLLADLEALFTRRVEPQPATFFTIS